MRRSVFKLAGDLSCGFLSFSSRNYFRPKANMNFSTDSSMGSDSVDHFSHIKKIQEFIPKLSRDLYKGQCGRIGVIGGSFEFTGAPFFAAISSLKLGADLVHVFCSRDAGTVIKSYSPELIVHPFLDGKQIVKNIAPWLERLHALVIGPGLGRDEDVLKNVAEIIVFCREEMKQPPPLIIDADGLHLITEKPDLIKNYNGPIILTPNVAEYERLAKKISERVPIRMAAHFNAILVQKGLYDHIINGIHHSKMLLYNTPLKCDVPGSCRRCGGQGDILAGCIGTFVAWLNKYLNLDPHFKSFKNLIEGADQQYFKDKISLYPLAVYGACVITRTSNRLAYEKHGRGMTASDMVQEISKAYRMHFD